MLDSFFFSLDDFIDIALQLFESGWFVSTFEVDLSFDSPLDVI